MSAIGSVGANVRRDARRAGALSDRPSDKLNDDRSPSMEEVERGVILATPFLGPIIRGATALRDALGLDTLQPSRDVQGPEGPGGRSRRRLFATVEEDRVGGPAGEADLANVGARGRRRRRLLGTDDTPPTTRRELLGI